MNICFLLEHFTCGGIGRVTALIGNGLVERTEHQIYGLCFAKNGAEDIYETHFPVTYVYERCARMANAILYRGYLTRVRKYITEKNIDVIVACGAEFYPIAVAAAIFPKVKVVCWEHTDPHQTKEYMFEKQRRIFGASFSDRNITLTKNALAFYNSQFPGKCNVQIYNPIDPVLMDTKVRYQDDSKKIISVGRLCYSKDYFRLLDIAAGVLREYTDWQWDIFGDGELRPELERRIDDLGLRGRVVLQGQCLNLYKRYGDYAFLVMTSRYEGFPMTLLEGAVNMLPLVAFDVPTGPSEIIRNGQNGYLCNINSNEEMIQSIRKLMANQSVRKQYAIQSRAIAETFSMERILPQWIHLFDELAGVESR